MAELQIQLLGSMQVKLNGQEITTFKLQKERALLAYLAVESSHPQRREQLAELLWPGYPEASAMGSLRFALSELRKHIDDRTANPPYLLINRDTLQLNLHADVWVDVNIFGQTELDGTQPHSIDQLQSSLDLYQGDFMEGFSLADCPAFEQWLLAEREQLHRRALQMLSILAEALEHKGDLAAASDCAYRQVALDPSYEPGYRQLMRLLALDGQRSAALAQYEACRKAMTEELGVEPSDETKQLYEAIRTESLAPASRIGVECTVPMVELPPAPGEPPFKGLQFFDVADAGLYFGREVLTKQLVSQVREMIAFRGTEEETGSCCLLAVVGASGSGKSSLVRAGLVAALQKSQALPEDSRYWPVHLITPTAHPLEALAGSLTRGSESVLAMATLVDDMRRDARSLHYYVTRLLGDSSSKGKPPQYLLLVIDQLEELFTTCRSEVESKAFIDNLLNAAHGPAIVVVTLRADFYAHCARHPGLRQALSTRQEYIGSMTAEELRRAIEEPARQGGWEFEPGLVDLILRDVGDEPGALPLLEHALLETWQRRSGRTLTLEGYASAGGVQGAIAHTANAVFAQLNQEEQELARHIFLRLTELGEGTQDTRRRALLTELIPESKDAPAIHALLKTLADARLVTLSEDTAEVAHEALIREWPALRTWLSEDRESLRLHRHLTEAAQEWEKMSRDTGELYRGARLAQAQEWAAQAGYDSELNALEKEFLEASKAQADRETQEREAQRQRELEAAQKLAESERKNAETERKNAEDQKQSAQRLRQRAIYLAAAAGLAVVLMIVAGVIALIANRNARQATAHQYASAALGNLATDPGQSISQALQSIQLEPSVEAFSVLHQALFANHMTSRFVAHQGVVYGIAVSPDGTRLATIGTDRVLKVWNLKDSTIQQPPVLTVPDTGLNYDQLVGNYQDFYDPLRFSPDGKYLATVNDLFKLELIDSFTGEEAGQVDLTGRYLPAIYSFDFSPLSAGVDKYRLAISTGSEIWIVELGGGSSQIFNTVLAHNGRGTSLAFRPDGTLVTAGWDWQGNGEVKLWTLTTQGDILYWHQTLVAGEEGDPVFHLSLSPDGNQVAFTTSNAAHILDLTPLASGLPPVERGIIPLESEISFYNTAVFHLPGGDRLVRADWRGRVAIFDENTGEALFTPAKPEMAYLTAIAVSPVNQVFFTAHSGGEVCSWDVADSRSPEWVAVPTGDVRAGVVLNSNGSDVLAWDVSNAGLGKWQFTRWSIENQQVVNLGGFTTETAPAPFSYALYFGPSRVAVGDSQLGQIRVLNPWTGERIQDIKTGVGLTDVAINSDGSRFYFAKSYGVVDVWDVTAGQKLATFKITPQRSENNPIKISLSKDDSLLVTMETVNPVVGLWNASSGQLVREIVGENIADSKPTLSPDNRFLITTGPNHTALVWEVATGKQVRKILLPDTPMSMQVSPDGRFLVVGLALPKTAIYDLATGRELVVLPGAPTWTPTNSAIGYQFSPDGRYILVTFPEDHMAYGFLLDNNDLVQLACQRLAAIALPATDGSVSTLPICKNQ